MKATLGNVGTNVASKIPFVKTRVAKKKQEADTKKKPPVADHTFHKLSINELTDLFKTSLSQGLSHDTAKALLAKNGKNELRKPKSQFFHKLFKYCFAGFCWLLWVGAFICFIAWRPIGNPPDPTNLGLAILLLLVIGLQAAFEAFQDWSSGKVMKSIKNMMPSDATVIRNGVECKVPVSDIVVGDVVLLTNGAKVPADVRIIESHDLKFDRSMLTGESEAIDGSPNCTDQNYNESKNVAFMATLITNGNGKAIVTLTGVNTMIGSIADLTSGAKEKKTTLQKEITRFVIIIAVLAITTVSICFIVWGAWVYRTYPTYIDVSAMLVNAIAILVAFIPTGLPVAVTLSLLLVARKMARNRVLVKNLTTVETLSCVNVIASDKTGTLTQNKMYVTNASAGLKVLNSVLARRASVQIDPAYKIKSTLQLLSICVICNESKFDEKDKDKPVNERQTSGGATDGAILKYAANTIEIETVEREFKEIAQVPFNSRNKWMSVVFNETEDTSNKRNSDSDNPRLDCFNLNKTECVVAIKGAPDILVKKCKWVLKEDGSQAEFDETERKKLDQLQIEWCKLGQRVLLICKKHEQIKNITFNTTTDLEKHIGNINDFCIVGMLGIIDRPREGIDEVIRTCRGAGIRVFMVTGDFSITAAAIAKEIGIFTTDNYDTASTMIERHTLMTKYASQQILSQPHQQEVRLQSLLLTGADLLDLTEPDWRIVTQYEEIVFARTSPTQKLQIVENLQIDKNIVAVTGDGVNDSPALKQADIGIAMGGGSEVAMEAAQMVLLDNSFNSLVVAIENGRLVFDNLRKVILYLLPAGSFSEVVPVILNIYFGVPSPLSAFQMICICVLTDMAPSLAMMLEKSEGDLLKRPPRKIGRDRLVDLKLLLFSYFFLGVFESFFSNFMYFFYLYFYGGFTPSQVFFAFDKWSGYVNTTRFNTTESLNDLQFTGQTVSFVSLVMVQTFGNIYITRAHYLSLWTSFPLFKAHRNIWLFVSQLVAIGLMLLVIYIPFCNSVFNTRPIPVEYYFYPLLFCLVFVSIDELRKFLVRKKVKIFVKTAW